jgi:hypothetical protein
MSMRACNFSTTVSLPSFYISIWPQRFLLFWTHLHFSYGDESKEILCYGSTRSCWPDRNLVAAINNMANLCNWFRTETPLSVPVKNACNREQITFLLGVTNHQFSHWFLCYPGEHSFKLKGWILTHQWAPSIDWWSLFFQLLNSPNYVMCGK